jgi:CDP-glycerol glycerophosphotransferase
VTTAPLVSVIIPIFRAESTIVRAIESVTSQGIEGVEIICVSDHSPDNSVEVVNQLSAKNPSITLIENPSNLGPGPTRNRGIEEAAGDYIVFLDADDLLLPGSLNRLTKMLQTSQPDLVLVGCEEERRGRVKSLTDGALWDSLISVNQLTSIEREPRVIFWPPAPWSKVYRREFLLSEGLRFGNGVAQDIPWSALVTLRAKTVGVCPGVFYRYVTAEKDSSITTTTSEKNLVRLAQVQKIRTDNDLTALSDSVKAHVSALAVIHLIWSNRAAYRLFPENTREQFFVDSAKELTWWHEFAPVPPGLDSRPLMSAVDRHTLATALRRGDWARWQKTLVRHKNLSRFRRMVRPGLRRHLKG